MLCANCLNPFDNPYSEFSSGKFCSRRCARSFGASKMHARRGTNSEISAILRSMPLAEFSSKVEQAHSQSAALRSLGCPEDKVNSLGTMLLEICRVRDVSTSHFLSRAKSLSKALLAKSDRKVEAWLAGEIQAHSPGGQFALHKWARRWVLTRAMNKCEKCGWSEVNEFTGLVPLQVHHKDGVASNSRPDNLIALCPNCHALTPNYGSRNLSCIRVGSRSYARSTTS